MISPIFEPYIGNDIPDLDNTTNTECNSIHYKNDEASILEIMKNLHKKNLVQENKFKDLFLELAKLQNCYKSLLNHANYISKGINALAYLAESYTNNTKKSKSNNLDINDLRKEILKLKESTETQEKTVSIFNEMHQIKDELKKVKDLLNEEYSENGRLQCEINQLKVIMRKEIVENSSSSIENTSVPQEEKNIQHSYGSPVSSATTIATSTVTSTSTSTSTGTSTSGTFLKRVTELNMGWGWWLGLGQSDKHQAG